MHKTLSAHSFDNQDGSVLLLALVMLFAVTLLGIFSTNTSTIETHVSANNIYYKKVFYAAEAGLEHALVGLRNQLATSNPSVFTDDGSVPEWDFALAGADADSPPGWDNRVAWLEDQALGDCRYSVFVYDDWDPAEGDAQLATDDANGRIFARAVATGPNGARAAVEMILEGKVDYQDVMDYTLQAGAGAAKASEGGDKDAISDFTTQASGLGT